MPSPQNFSPNDGSLLISSLILRRLVGLLGIFLPIGLILASGLVFKPSISEYYDTPYARNILVGVMCSVGVFLCCYKGYDIKDWVLSLVAGLAAIGVALCPVAPKDAMGWVFVRGMGHFAFATLFLGSLAYMVLHQFTQTDATKKKPMTERKAIRNQLYRSCGWAMVVCLLVIFFYKIPPTHALLSFLDPIDPVFWLESLSVWGFGWAWLVKGEGLLGDKTGKN